MSLANQWRVKAREAALAAAVDLELPSGMVIRARRPTPMLLASHGSLPLSLAAVANPGTSGTSAQTGTAEMMAFLRDMLLHCVVEPAISLTPTADQIRPSDIPDDDVAYILGWATRGEEAVSLESFRAKRNDGGAISDGGEVRPTSEYASRYIRSGPSPEFRFGSDSNPIKDQTGN